MPVAPAGGVGSLSAALEGMPPPPLKEKRGSVNGIPLDQHRGREQSMRKDPRTIFEDRGGRIFRDGETS